MGRPLIGRAVLTIFALLVALCGDGEAGAEAPTYTYTPLVQGTKSLTPYAINNAGTVVGEASDKNAFILSGSGYTEVTPQPGDVEVRFIDTNSAGKIIASGTEGDSASTVHTYRFDGGAYGPADPAGTYYNGLDDENHLVGSVTDVVSGLPHGLYDAAKFDVPGAVGTYLACVTNTVRGSILATGEWLDSSSNDHPFIRDVTQGTNTNIVIASVPSAYVIGINSFGTVVGWYANPGDGQYRSYVRTIDGVLSDFEVPNARQTFAYGINDSGSIVGVYVDQGYKYVGFLATVSNSYSFYEVISAMQMAAGLDTFGGFSDPPRFDIDGDLHVTMHDVAIMARKVGGLEPNP